MRLSWLQEVKEAVQSINLPTRHFAGDGTVDVGATDAITREEVASYLNNMGIFEQAFVPVRRMITKDDAISGAVFYSLHFLVSWGRITNITRDDLYRAELTGSIGRRVELPSKLWNQLVDYATKLANLAVDRSTKHGSDWWRYSIVEHDARGYPKSLKVDALTSPWIPHPPRIV
ncbi:MAG: hypothetical protein DRP95_00105 [Candidatus Latescibacterota bacterium]|nr:MAG: hypothetical protein DRP95_00105 [Candidatus Latescibacterota bacterium]